LTNTATIAADNEDPNFGSDNSATATITVQCPDLTITKVADKGSVSAGDQAGYTLTVTNNGPGKAFDVVLNDTLPANPGLSWSVESTTGGWTCGITAGELTCGGAECVGAHHLADHLGDVRHDQQHRHDRRLERQPGLDRDRSDHRELRGAEHLEGCRRRGGQRGRHDRLHDHRHQ
jgi:uncharacterized repeat protein (TIGR01451 family)